MIVLSGNRSGVDDGLVDMVIQDSQPFYIVKDEGFKELVATFQS